MVLRNFVSVLAFAFCLKETPEYMHLLDAF